MEVEEATAALAAIEQDLPRVSDADKAEHAQLQERIRAGRRDLVDIKSEVDTCNVVINRVLRQTADYEVRTPTPRYRQLGGPARLPRRAGSPPAHPC